MPHRLHMVLISLVSLGLHPLAGFLAASMLYKRTFIESSMLRGELFKESLRGCC